MLLINNLTGVVVCLFLTYINTWQTGITSSILIGGFILLLTFFSNGTDKQLNEKGKVDTTAEVRGLEWLSRVSKQPGTRFNYPNQILPSTGGKEHLQAGILKAEY